VLALVAGYRDRGKMPVDGTLDRDMVGILDSVRALVLRVDRSRRYPELIDVVRLDRDGLIDMVHKEDVLADRVCFALGHVLLLRRDFSVFQLRIVVVLSLFLFRKRADGTVFLAGRCQRVHLRSSVGVALDRQFLQGQHYAVFSLLRVSRPWRPRFFVIRNDAGCLDLHGQRIVDLHFRGLLCRVVSRDLMGGVYKREGHRHEKHCCQTNPEGVSSHLSRLLQVVEHFHS